MRKATSYLARAFTVVADLECTRSLCPTARCFSRIYLQTRFSSTGAMASAADAKEVQTQALVSATFLSLLNSAEHDHCLLQFG